MQRRKNGPNPDKFEPKNTAQILAGMADFSITKGPKGPKKAKSINGEFEQVEDQKSVFQPKKEVRGNPWNRHSVEGYGRNPIERDQIQWERNPSRNTKNR